MTGWGIHCIAIPVAKGIVVMAGLPSAHGSSVARGSCSSDDLLLFESDVLRLINLARSADDAREVGIHASLLAEARQVCGRSAASWRLFRDSLRRRILSRGRFIAGLEVSSLTTTASPEVIVARWMRRRRTRRAILDSTYGVGAVGVVVEVNSSRACVVLLMGKLRDYS
jgi:hypothetical protein